MKSHLNSRKLWGRQTTSNDLYRRMDDTVRRGKGWTRCKVLIISRRKNRWRWRARVLRFTLGPHCEAGATSLFQTGQSRRPGVVRQQELACCGGAGGVDSEMSPFGSSSDEVRLWEESSRGRPSRKTGESERKRGKNGEKMEEKARTLRCHMVRINDADLREINGRYGRPK